MRFQPSALSNYGEDAPPADPAAAPPAEEQHTDYSQYVPLAKKLLGIDDPERELPALKARLAALETGNPVQVLAAIAATGITPGVGARERAIAKVKELIAAAEAQASKARTRDTMYTLLTVGGVTLLFGLTALVAVKTYGASQQAKMYRSQAGK